MPVARKPRRPRFYFSFRSPYSWLAAKRIHELYPYDRGPLEYIPCWEAGGAVAERFLAMGGENLYTTISHAKTLYVFQDVRRLAAKFGYQFTWPVDLDNLWDLPHLGYLCAERVGRAREYFWAAYAARWNAGQDIKSEAGVRAVAAEAGVDSDGLIQAIQTPHIIEEGARKLLASYEDSVFGVPFFTYGVEKFWGVDRIDFFLDTVRQGELVAHKEEAP